MHPFFSVVIPLYNKQNYVQNTVQSVLDQTYENFELIIVNDGSTDNSLEVVKKIKSDKIKIVEQKNQGVSVARNTGISNASGKYIALLDADDYWYPHHLIELKKVIQLHPHAGIFCMGYEILIDGNKLEKANYNLKEPNKIQLIDDYFNASIINPVIWTSASAFSKEKFKEIGRFDKKLRTAQDLDFFVRAALKFKVSFNPQITMRYHQTSENNLAQSFYNEDRAYFINKFSVEEKSNESLKKYLDINRYALVIRCRMISNNLWKDILPAINKNNLTSKQRTLLYFPSYALRVLKKFQLYLIRKGVYLTAFK